VKHSANNVGERKKNSLECKHISTW